MVGSRRAICLPNYPENEVKFQFHQKNLDACGTRQVDFSPIAFLSAFLQESVFNFSLGTSGS